MEEQLEKRLKELKTEFDKGQTKVQELEEQTNSLRNTLLRISGAIQVLEELLVQETPPAEDAVQPLIDSCERSESPAESG